MELTNIKRVDNGSCLKATFKGDASWINFPKNEYKDKEGKTKYFTMAGWPDDIQKEYEREAKEILNKQIPEQELPF
jgi:hypothetical protein